MSRSLNATELVEGVSHIIALRLRYCPYPGATSRLTLSSVSRMMTSGSLRSSRKLLTELLPPLLWCQGAVPVSDVAEADAVAVAVAVAARSGRRRRGCVEEVLEAGERGRAWGVVSSYLMVWK